MFVLDRNRNGAIAEAEIYAAAVRLGLRVYLPANDHSRIDMVFALGGRLLGVQCKWGRLSEDKAVVIVKTGTSRCTPHGYAPTTYREDEVDLFAVYRGGKDRCYLIPGARAADDTSSGSVSHHR